MVEKKYISIKEVSKLLDLNMHVIRYWDSKFDGISTRIGDKTQRFFNKENIKRIKDLKNTLYNNGKPNYSLNLAKKIIDGNTISANKINKSLNQINYSPNNKNLIVKIQEVKENLMKILNL